jgi:tRNA (Thr-GGU) A37 N-methylase
LIEHTGRSIKVKYLDAIDGTPVLDIKPVFREFESKTEIKQAKWVNDLMKDYWK